MGGDDLQIVRKVLGVLHDVDEIDVGHPDYEKIQIDRDFDGSFVLEYDLRRTPSVQLPSPVLSIMDTIDQHLRHSDSADPWGFIEEQWIILKLEKQPFSNCGKLLLFNNEFISKNLEKLFPNAGITNAERRMLLQSLAGITLKGAAELDSVSYETKKSQLKSVFRKTHLNSQQALSNFLLTHFTLELTSKLSRNSGSAESDDMFFHYVDTYMGSYVRASVVQESANKRYRIIEIGDPTGTPVVCVHHLGIVNFSEEEINYIYHNGLRLICPLRHGALGPADPKITSEQHLEHAVAGIELAVSLTGRKNTVVLSLLSGCMYALHYCKRHAEKVDKLIMLGASYKPPLDTPVTSKFKKNLHDLAMGSERTLELAISTMLDSVDQPVKLKKVVQESNNNGVADNLTIDELFSDENQVAAMQHRLRNSPQSIVQDLKKQAVKDWTLLQHIGLATEVHFIHGSEDALIPIDNINHLITQLSGARIHIVEGAGNWIFGRYTSRTTSIIRSIIDS